MLIVFNPAAGAGRRRRLARALATLARLGLRPELAETERPGHATLLAREAAARGVPMVVAAGGDGTIAEVATGIAGSAAALGLLPLGTANVLASELGVPPAPERAAAVLAEGRSAVLRPGLASWPDGRRRLFVQMMGAGFDAAVVHRLDLDLKRRLGRGAYVVQSLRELARYRFPRFVAELDGAGGAEESVVSAIVTKGRLYAGRHLLAPGARPAEPGFQVALFRRGGPGFAALCGAALPFDLLPRVPGVVLRPALRIRLTARTGEEVPIQADGDPAGLLPVSIEDAPGPITVRLPGAAAAG
jgi:diacylglycerol kinase (ATP)